jgi:hypothetical protein
MHTAISVCEITYMGIQDLISRMEIFRVRIQLVTHPRMQTGISVIPVCIQGLILIPVCIRGLYVMRSPYAYGDHHAIPVCIRG